MYMPLKKFWNLWVLPDCSNLQGKDKCLYPRSISWGTREQRVTVSCPRSDNKTSSETRADSVTGVPAIASLWPIWFRSHSSGILRRGISPESGCYIHWEIPSSLSSAEGKVDSKSVYWRKSVRFDVFHWLQTVPFSVFDQEGGGVRIIEERLE